MNLSRPGLVFVNRVYRPSTEATSQLLTDLAEALAARGWPVQVVASGEKDEVQAGVRIHRTGPGDTRRGLVSRALAYLRFVREARHRMENLVRPGDVAVFMTDPPMLGPFGSGIVRQRGGATVHWIQDIYPEIVPAHVGRWMAPLLAPLRWWRNRAWRAAAACVPVGTDMAAHVAGVSVPAGRVLPVFNWAPRELDTPAAPAAAQALREKWGVADKFVVAYSGNLGRVHEFATILGAAERLRGDPGIVFLFIGDGPQLPEVRAAVEGAGLSNVRFLPAQPRAELAASLAAADAHLVTLRPAFARLVNPSKLAGVLAAGRPALFVGPPDGETARLLAGEDCGRAIAPGDSAVLAAACRELRQQPAVRERLGRNARAAHGRHFNLAGAVARWEEILTTAGAGR